MEFSVKDNLTTILAFKANICRGIRIAISDDSDTVILVLKQKIPKCIVILEILIFRGTYFSV